MLFYPSASSGTKKLKLIPRIIASSPLLILEEIEGARLDTDVKGIRVAIWLETKAHLPTMQIASQPDIGVGYLFGSEIIPDISEVNRPIRSHAHAADQIDRVGRDHGGVLAGASGA